MILSYVDLGNFVIDDRTKPQSLCLYALVRHLVTILNNALVSNQRNFNEINLLFKNLKENSYYIRCSSIQSKKFLINLLFKN